MPDPSATRPRISIGLPVFNGERYVAQALDALLAQSFGDFELIICDNASTDSTGDICRDYAARDGRIRYVRNPENIGVNRNFNRSFELSVAPYFHWAAADDLCEPALLETLLAVLEERPEVALSYSETREIDGTGKFIRDVSDAMNIDDPSPSRRFSSCLWKVYMCNPLFGLIRTDALRRTGLFGNYSNSDIVLLCELTLYGKFVEVPYVLFSRRIHDGMAVKKYVTAHARMAMSVPGIGERLTFPNFLFFGGFFSAIHRSPLGLCQRLRCYFSLHICGRRWKSRLWEDVRYAWRHLRRAQT